MPLKNVDLTKSEWGVLECLWDGWPKTGREVVDYLKKSAGWKRSTSLTMLRRMSEKGLVLLGEKDGVNVYSPLVRQEDAVIKETCDFLNRVYKGSVSMMVSAMTRKERLTKAEIEELYAVLQAAEEKEG